MGRDGERWGEGLKEMGRGIERDAEREGYRWGEGGKEMGRGRERDGEREGEMVPHNSWSKWSHRFSMGFRSGLQAGQSILLTPACCRKVFTTRARWGVALLSCHQSTPRTTATTAPTISEA